MDLRCRHREDVEDEGCLSGMDGLPVRLGGKDGVSREHLLIADSLRLDVSGPVGVVTLFVRPI